jgi:hypothetical protein
MQVILRPDVTPAQKCLGFSNQIPILVKGNCQILGLVLFFFTKIYILPSDTGERLNIAIMTGRDSDLEAFSHNPSDGSFAPFFYRRST